MSDLSEDPQIIADNNGWRLIIPEPGELFLDIDTATQKKTISPRGNTHLYVRVDSFSASDDPILRIAWQAIMGSDPKREALSLIRILLGIKRPPTIFFETQL